VIEQLHKNFCNKSNKMSTWFCDKAEHLMLPIYSSYDIRDATFKVSNVDANIFPAGFNNICPTDKDTSGGLMTQYLDRHYGNHVKNILLVTEEHTNNPYYWENVLTIKGLLESAEKSVLIAIPKVMDGPLKIQSSTGKEVLVFSAFESSLLTQNFKPDLIISNNDFSNAYEDWAAQLTIPVNPPRELGWYQRKKSRYFENYNKLTTEFADLVGFDPFMMTVQTNVFSNFDMSEDTSKKMLADSVDSMIANLKVDYKKRGITQEPFVFVKNNSGTYGLAVMRAGSGEEVLKWNNRSRTKMKAAKGGRDVEEVIVQEGIVSTVQSEGITAEPVIYMIGSELAGGFLRTHAEKGNSDSLNSPGAVYKKLCVSDLNVSLEGSPLENVYGWSARLGLLAIAYEAEQMNVKFDKYKP
jgi:glutamate--cysteine ligase